MRPATNAGDLAACAAESLPQPAAGLVGPTGLLPPTCRTRDSAVADEPKLTEDRQADLGYVAAAAAPAGQQPDGRPARTTDSNARPEAGVDLQDETEIDGTLGDEDESITMSKLRFRAGRFSSSGSSPAELSSAETPVDQASPIFRNPDPRRHRAQTRRPSA